MQRGPLNSHARAASQRRLAGGGLGEERGWQGGTRAARPLTRRIFQQLLVPHPGGDDPPSFPRRVLHQRCALVAWGPREGASPRAGGAGARSCNGGRVSGVYPHRRGTPCIAGGGGLVRRSGDAVPAASAAAAARRTTRRRRQWRHAMAARRERLRHVGRARRGRGAARPPRAGAASSRGTPLRSVRGAGRPWGLAGQQQPPPGRAARRRPSRWGAWLVAYFRRVPRGTAGHTHCIASVAGGGAAVVGRGSPVWGLGGTRPRHRAVCWATRPLGLGDDPTRDGRGREGPFRPTRTQADSLATDGARGD